MPCFYLTPKQDDFNQELQICIAEALYDVDSIVADPGTYTKEQAHRDDASDFASGSATVQQTRMRVTT